VIANVDRALAVVMWVAAALVVVALLAGPELIGARKETPAAAATAAPSGKAVFASAGCGGCHTLAAAGASGQVGPNLDELKPDAAAVEAVVNSGSGVMPSFKGKLSSEEIKAVAAFVSGEEPKPEATAEAAPARAKTIRAGKGPDGITLDGGDVVVADASAGTLIRISGDRAGRPVAAGHQPDSPVVDGDVTWVVASGDDAVRRNGRAIAVGKAPESLAVGERSVWVTNAGDGTVSRIDKASGKVVGDPIPVGRRPLDITIAGGIAWVSSFDDGTVTRIDTRTGKVVGDPIEVGGHLRGIAAGDGTVWVADATNDVVTPIDTADLGAGESIKVGKDPRELAVDGGSVWVANAGDDTVTRIDAAGRKAAGEPIAVGDDPIGIAAGGGVVWTANFRDGTVSKIVVP
jgi:YVTN family beta-propeller protein